MISKIKKYKFLSLNTILWFIITLWFILMIWPIIVLPLTGDESIYFYHAWILKIGKKFYNEFWGDDKGPGIHLLYYLFSRFDNSFHNFYLVKLLTIIYQFITVILFFNLTKIIFKNYKYVEYLLTILFVLIYLNPLIEGQYSNGDNFPVLFILLTFLLFIKKRYYLSAFIIGLSFTIKQNTALEIMPVSLTFIIMTLLESKLLSIRFLKIVKTILLQILIFLLPSMFFIIYLIFFGNFNVYLSTTFIDRINSHILYKNYNYAIKYFSAIYNETSTLWIGMILFLIFFFKIRNFKKNRTSDDRIRFIQVIEQKLLINEEYIIYIFFWILFSSLSVYIGGYFFPHYFIEISPVIIIASTITFLIFKQFYFIILVPILLFNQLHLTVKLSIFQYIIIIIIFLYIIGFILTYNKNTFFQSPVSRICIMLFFLLFSLKTNPFNQTIKFINSKNPYMFYNNNDLDIIKSSKYIIENKLSNVFIYDYTQEIYFFTEIYPTCDRPTKVHYIDFSELIPEHGVYYGLKNKITSSLNCIKENLNNNKFDFIIINYNTILEKEPEHMKFLFDIMLEKYSYYTNFGGIWFYKFDRIKSIKSYTNEKIVSVKHINEQYIINVHYSGMIPIQTSYLKCGTTIWKYPEDGIIYPMKGIQQLNTIKFEVNDRGVDNVICDLELKTFFNQNINLKINLNK